MNGVYLALDCKLEGTFLCAKTLDEPFFSSVKPKSKVVTR